MYTLWTGRHADRNFVHDRDPLRLREASYFLEIIYSHPRGPKFEKSLRIKFKRDWLERNVDSKSKRNLSSNLNFFPNINAFYSETLKVILITHHLRYMQINVYYIFRYIFWTFVYLFMEHKVYSTKRLCRNTIRIAIVLNVFPIRERERLVSRLEQNASTATNPRWICIWVILTASLKRKARLIHEMSGGQTWNLSPLDLGRSNRRRRLVDDRLIATSS